MQCLHCLVHYHGEYHDEHIGKDGRNRNWWAQLSNCPNCGEFNIRLRRDSWIIQVYPQNAIRPFPFSSVPTNYSNDYKEAAVVLSHSAKASAALSRRCLQNLLQEHFKIDRNKKLYDQIEDLINSGKTPSHVNERLHHVRVIGNFAAHPMKSTNTGEVIDVEPGEAEWLLDTLDSLFDFCFEQPKKLAEQKTAINKKLQESGKKPI